MPKKLTTILGDLLHVAKYAIKTGIGLSKETYHHSDESPAVELYYHTRAISSHYLFFAMIL
jgi:hypothetical protein